MYLFNRYLKPAMEKPRYTVRFTLMKLSYDTATTADGSDKIFINHYIESGYKHKFCLSAKLAKWTQRRFANMRYVAT